MLTKQLTDADLCRILLDEDAGDGETRCAEREVERRLTTGTWENRITMARTLCSPQHGGDGWHLAEDFGGSLDSVLCVSCGQLLQEDTIICGTCR